jgi:hypothetical protein
VPSFRLDHTKVAPGDVTASMALPWQSDFLACDRYWWPVPRPNEVKVAGPPGPNKSWNRAVANRDEFVAGKWNKMGFVTRQGNDLVETDACASAETWVSLVTPALTFHDVPQGPLGITRKAARAVVYEVRSATPVTLTITAGPSDPSLTRFTATPLTVAATGGAVTTVRMWIVYAAPNPTHVVAADSVTVSCPETSQTWVVPITANAVPRKTAATALVLDRSFSMSEDRGDGLGTKSQSVRDAANTFLDVMLPGDALSLTAFNDSAAVVRALTALGDPNDPFDVSRSEMRSAINGPGLDPAGSTSIGEGIVAGRGTLTGATAAAQSLVVLTDGNENRPRWIADVAGQINETTYAVGVGTSANTSAAALETVSGNHGGYLLITGSALGGDNQFLLKKYFLQVLAGVSNAEVVLDPVGLIVAGQVQRVPFVVCDEDGLIDVILMANDRKNLLFLLEDPYGRLIDPALARAAGGQFVATDQISYYRFPQPLLVEPGRPSLPGTWNAVLAYEGRAGGEGPFTHVEASVQSPDVRVQSYSVVVHAWSDISLTASVHQGSLTPGATVTVLAALSAAGVPLTQAANLTAEITRPGGTVATVSLAPDGEQFAGSFVATGIGDYRIRVRAVGTTSRGFPFTRERVLSAGVWRGGDTPPRGGPDDVGAAIDEHDRRWCAALRCILLTLAGNDALMRRWGEVGFDPRELLRCVELLCGDRAGKDVRAELPMDAVRRLVAELRRTLGGP